MERPEGPAQLPQADERLTCARRRRRLHAAAAGAHRSVRSTARRSRARVGPSFLQAQSPSGVSRGRCSLRATWADRPKSRATLSIPPVLAPPTSSRKPLCSASTIRIGRRQSPIVANCAPGPSISAAIASALNGQKAMKGAGLRILTEPITSPSLSEAHGDDSPGLPASAAGTSSIPSRPTVDVSVRRPARRPTPSITSTRPTSSSRSMPISSVSGRRWSGTRGISPIAAASPTMPSG